MPDITLDHDHQGRTHTHAGSTWDGGALEILDLTTTETDADLVLAPDGSGGVEFRAEAGGSSVDGTEGGSTVVSGVSAVDAGNGLDASNPSGSVLRLTVDPSEIKLDDLGAPDDNTDLDASTSAHGLLRKLDNNSAHFLDGTGGWTTPSGGGGGAMTQIGATILGSAAASISFTSISGGYNNLRLIVVGRTSHASFDQEIRLRFNGDTGSNYDWQFGKDTSATALAAEEDFAKTYAFIGNVLGTSGPANIPGITVVDIPLYAGTTFHKTGLFHAGEVGQSTGDDRFRWGHFTWRDTSAITQVDVSPAGGNFVAGSAAFLYGIT